MPSSPPALVVWRFTDGKPGHEKQTLGLVRALARSTAVQCHDIPAPGRLASLLRWVARRFPEVAGLPSPHLILAAGHGTHLAALAARRVRGGRLVALMRPSLPLACFDLCLIPAHDAPPARANVVATRGVLNVVRPATHPDPHVGLILLGGVSTHYRWDDAAVVRDVLAIVRAAPQVDWRLTTSRRTPAGFLAVLAAQPRPANLAIVPGAETPPGWLEQALDRAGRVWVSEDSVSMIYEALTAGAQVGVLRLPPLKDSRVRRGVESLIAEGVLLTDNRPMPPRTATLAPLPFDEAERCARLILQAWFPPAP